tara:strand:+ start:60 stop:1463 length:1404 start_codon:yes stop_codon:yes gene_type:complete
MNIAQLHERVKNLSDRQLVGLSQRGDTTASLALMELNNRNDIREKTTGEMGKAPTIAEQERAKVIQGIGTPPIDPSMISPQMVQGVGNPTIIPQPISRDTGVSQLPAPVMEAAGGGLVALANGGQVIPFQNEGLVAPEGYEYSPSRYEGIKEYFRGPNPLDFLMTPESYLDMGQYAIDNPGEVLGAGAKAGLGVLGLGKFKFAKKAYDKAKKLKDKLKFDPKDLYSKKIPGFFLGKNPRTFDPYRTALTGGIGTIAADEGADFLFDPRLTKIDPASKKQGELMGPPKPKPKPDPKPDPKKEEDSKDKKGGLASRGLNYGLAVGGLKLFQGDKAGDAAEAGVKTALAIDKAAREKELVDFTRDIKKKTLDLDLKKLAKDMRLKPSTLFKAKKDYLDSDAANAIRQALRNQAKKQGGTTNNKILNAEINKALAAGFIEYLGATQKAGQDADLINYIDSLLANQGIAGLM